MPTNLNRLDASPDMPVAKPVFDLNAITRKLQRNWWILAGFGIFGFFWAMISLHNAHYEYSAKMVVMSVNATDSDAPSRLSSLASLAGINLRSSSSTTQFQLYLDSLNSRAVANELAKDKPLMHKMFGGEWNAKTQTWHPPKRSLLSSTILGIEWLFGFPQKPWRPPDGERVQGYLNYYMHTSSDPSEPFTATVMLDTYHPALAVEILTKLDKVADEYLRQKALLRANQYVAYITDQLAKVTLAEQREALTQSLSDQEKYAMMANAGDSFAAALFDPPFVPPRPIDPLTIPTYLRWIFLWGLLGVILVLTSSYYKTSLDRVLAKIPTDKLPGFMQRALQP